MALRIIKSSEVIRVERLNVVIYAQPGIGKSTLAFTADAPLMLDFDLGSHRALGRKDVVRISSWPEVVDIGADDFAPYKTVLVDTAGRALDLLTTDILRRNPKAGSGGALSLKGFGQLKTEFIAWMKMVNAFGLDVVLVLHMDESRNGDEIVERLDLTGGSKAEVYKAADAMGRILMVDGKRVLNFNPSDTAFGKNPGQLPPMSIPHPDKDATFLATAVIAATKAKLNELTAAQSAAVTMVEEWREKVIAFQSLQAFNAAIPEVRATRNKAILSLFETAAAYHGYTFDRETKAFVAPVAEKQDQAGGSAMPAPSNPRETQPAPADKPTFGDVVDPAELPGESQPVEQAALL